MSVDDLSLKESLEDKVKVSKKVETVIKVAEPTQTDEPSTFDSPETEAKYYRSQADKMAKLAAEMRRKAEELVPTKKKV